MIFLHPVRQCRHRMFALKVNVKQCSIDPLALGDDTQDRSAWRTLCHEAVTQFKDSRVEALEHKRAVRKGAQPCSNLSAWPCDSCPCVCSSRIIELQSTPINKLTDDRRSFVFDGAVRSVPFFVCLRHKQTRRLALECVSNFDAKYFGH